MKNDVLLELKETAEDMGTTQVGLVKLCVISFIRWAKANNIRRLPDDWKQLIEEMDGRKTRYAQMNQIKVADASNGTYVPKKRRKKEGRP